MTKKCPFLKDNCKESCVFRRDPVSTKNGTTTCQLAYSSILIEDVLDDYLREKEKSDKSE